MLLISILVGMLFGLTACEGSEGTTLAIDSDGTVIAVPESDIPVAPSIADHSAKAWVVDGYPIDRDECAHIAEYAAGKYDGQTWWVGSNQIAGFSGVHFRIIEGNIDFWNGVGYESRSHTGDDFSMNTDQNVQGEYCQLYWDGTLQEFTAAEYWHYDADLGYAGVKEVIE